MARTSEYSLREAGRLVGVSHQTVAKWRSGRVGELQPATRRLLISYLESSRVGSELRLGAIAYQYGPANPDQPNTFSIVLYLASTSRDWQYLYSRPTVDLLVDGERVHLGEATRSSRVRDGYVTEDMLLIVPRETLQRIAEARQVSGQLAHTRFDLQPSHLERIKEFLAAIPSGEQVAIHAREGCRMRALSEGWRRFGRGP